MQLQPRNARTTVYDDDKRGRKETCRSGKKTQLEGKWGKKVIEAAYTSVPDVLIRYQQRLKVKPLDVNVLLHLLSYWWKAPDLPRPSKNTRNRRVLAAVTAAAEAQAL